MSIDQLNYYHKKLAYEMDSWDLYLAKQNADKLCVVDGRSNAAFVKEHIPKSINLPHREICFNSTEHLDKNIVYICYCDGIGCNASTKTAVKLLSLGFQVKELIGGLDWWKRDGYATEGEAGQDGTQIECGC